MSVIKFLSKEFESEIRKCLVCNCVIDFGFGWADIIFDSPNMNLCSSCQKKLNIIAGDTCCFCNRELSQLSIEHYRDDVCMDCLRWQQNGQQYLNGNISVFNYNDFMKGVISRIKYRGDYKLMWIFETLLKEKVNLITKKEEYVVIPIPLSEERHLERGFNQAEAFGKMCGFNMTHALKRVHSEKQSKKSRSERIRSEQVFQLNAFDLMNKKILLLDDIYTTGTTLQHASQVLKVQGDAKEVWSLTIARS